MTKEKGQGFARRVTLGSLKSFAPLLAEKGQPSRTPSDLAKHKEESEKQVADSAALRDAEALFNGTPVKYSLPFTRHPAKSRSARVIGGKPAKVTVNTATHVSTSISSVRGRQRWEKILTMTDAQRQAGNPTGDIRLTAAKWKEGGKVIDHTTYFRNDLFQGFTWRPKNKKVIETIVPFELTILGKHYGVRNLTVSHKPTGEAGQRNYTTGIQWGELISVIRKHNLTGRIIRIYDPLAGGGSFFIEIL